MRYTVRAAALAIAFFVAFSAPISAENIFLLPDNISTVEARAFEGIPADGVFLPETVTSVSTDAFALSGTGVMDIYGFSGGNAERIATETSAKFVSVSVLNATVIAPEWASSYSPTDISASAISGVSLTFDISIEKNGREIFASDDCTKNEITYSFTEGGIYDINCTFSNQWQSAVASAQIEIGEPIKIIKDSFTIPVLSEALFVDDAETREIELVSSDPDGLEISGTSIVGLRVGEYAVTARTSAGEGRLIEREIPVSVVTPAESVLISQPDNIEIGEGDEITLTAVASPSEAQQRGIIWSSDDAEIATIDSNGTVKGVSKGETVVRAQLDDAFDERTVKVNKYVSAFDIRVPSAPKELTTGMTAVFTYTATPSDASDITGEWLSSNDEIVRIDPVTGESRLLKAGEVDISVMANDEGGASSLIALNVLQGVESIEFPSAEIEIQNGEMLSLQYEINPQGAYNGALSWHTSNAKVATVSQSGALTTNTTGECVITAIASNGVSASVRVKVTVGETLAETPLSIVHMNIGSRANAGAFSFVYPENATYKNLTWQSSEPEIVAINSESGAMVANRTGLARITGLTKHGHMVEFVVNVIEGKVITKLAMSEKYHVAKLGDSFALKTTYNSDAQIKNCVWYSDDTSVCQIASGATLDSALIQTVGIGTANVYAISSSGIASVCQVLVNPIVTNSIRLNITSTGVNVGDAFALSYTRTPNNASNFGISWSSSDERVATVDSDGIVRAVGGGSAYITVTTEDGISAECAVTVNSVLMSSAAVLSREISGKAGDQYQIRYTFAPENATPASFIWRSDNTDVAEVDEHSGLVTFTGEGETVVRGTAADGGGVEVEVFITALETKVTAFDVDSDNVTIEKGGAHPIQWAVVPEDASFAVPVFMSSDETVATVDKNGVITAVKRGSAVISASVGRGAYRRTAEVNVTVTGESDVKYRALVLGQFSQSSEEHYLPFSTNGTKGVRDAFARSVIDGDKYDVKLLGNNPSVSQITSALNNLANAADENDVTVVFLLTHGGFTEFEGDVKKGYVMQTSAGVSIKPAGIIGALKTISGHVVFVLCTCNSGGILAEDAVKAVMTGGGEYMGKNGAGKLSILCSSSNTRSSYYDIADESKSRDFFTYAFTRGLGWDMIADSSIVKPQADYNGDGFVTLNELSKYSRVNTQKEISAFLQRNAGAFYGHVNQYPSWWFATGEGDLALFGY